MRKNGPFVRVTQILAAAAAAAALAPGCAVSQQRAPTPGPSMAAAGTGFADLADVTIPAALVGDVVVRNAVRVADARAPGLAPGRARLFVEAEVVALIRGPDGVPPMVRFLADLPLDERARPPKVEKQRFLIFGSAVAGRPGELRLVAPDAMLAWRPADDAAVRALARELVDGRAPPAVTGIASAFHVPGTVIGESETQIFLSTADGAPVSVSVVRRPGQAPRWGAAFGEVVDDAAGPPAPATLGWYRLACAGLPAVLPPDLVESGDPAAAAADWALVRRDLGACVRAL